jgi:hypothetical protein
MRRSQAFRRNNVIIDTDQIPEGSLAAIAEPLPSKCAGNGASQLIERPASELERKRRKHLPGRGIVGSREGE